MNAALVAAFLVAMAIALLLPSRRPPRAVRLPASRPFESLGRSAWQAIDARISGHGGARRNRARVREAIAAVAAELRAGQPVRQALERGCAPADVARRARGALEWGGDIPDALRADAASPGCELLGSVAACWSVAEGRGAGLASALERLVDADRAADEVRAQLDAHLAAPRATARMLATLPLLGLVMGMAFGGDPLGWLLGSLPGRACLLAGLALIGLGLFWTSRIVARVERLL